MVIKARTFKINLEHFEFLKKYGQGNASLGLRLLIEGKRIEPNGTKSSVGNAGAISSNRESR